MEAGAKSEVQLLGQQDLGGSDLICGETSKDVSQAGQNGSWPEVTVIFHIPSFPFPTLGKLSVEVHLNRTPAPAPFGLGLSPHLLSLSSLPSRFTPPSKPLQAPSYPSCPGILSAYQPLPGYGKGIQDGEMVGDK